jgi:hypothetical protein
MPDWKVSVIVPLIALAVWVLGTLFRGTEEKGRPRRPGEGPRGPTRRPVTDLDRFLEEARRRREVAERRTVPGGSRGEGPSPEVVPVPPREQRPARASPPRVAERRPVRPREVPTARPVSPPAPRRPPEQVPEVIPVRVLEAVPVEPRAEAPPGEAGRLALESPPPRATRDRPPSPAVAQAVALLSNPKTAAAALVLREILGEPLCRRRHR